ncbi:phage holin, lambda family [Pasteurellaceae bacterium 15-036681]|nr:phage holin, lambda family [Pasteurellaceae bacterium 15-036681]
MKMPTKNPDVWANIWNWIALHMNSINSFFFAFAIAFLRIAYVGKERKCWRIFVECLLCGMLAVASESVFEYANMPTKLSVALGAIIAMFGIDKVREFAKKYVDKKVSKNE